MTKETSNSELKENIRADTPKLHPHYPYEKLNHSERMLISLVYTYTWRKFVKRSKVSKNQKLFFSLYFKQLHASYYTRVVRGPTFITNYRLKRNFLLSRANENLRIILQSFNPLNLTSFIHGMRSQIELNALVAKFIGNEEYLKNFLFLNEDRKKVNEQPTVVNVNTLVKNLDIQLDGYQEIYDTLSLLLHPNPSAVKFYAQAEKKDNLSGSILAQPKLKFYFNETVSATEFSRDWFEGMTWSFLAHVEHFLFLFDKLSEDDLKIDADPKALHEAMMMEITTKYEKEILRVANTAVKSGEDVNRATNKFIIDLINKETFKN
nr:hypothetical protein [uncultured Albidiferax sp.]